MSERMLSKTIAGALANFAIFAVLVADAARAAAEQALTGRAEGLWQRMYHFYQFNRAEFLQHYHKRSNIESTFSMIKAKFRDHVRSKTDVAMKNEVLCKIICHNICCLIQESHELGIDTTFWAETSPAQEAALN